MSTASCEVRHWIYLKQNSVSFDDQISAVGTDEFASEEGQEVDHPDILASVSKLALLLQNQGKYEEMGASGRDETRSGLLSYSRKRHQCQRATLGHVITIPQQSLGSQV